MRFDLRVSLISLVLILAFAIAAASQEQASADHADLGQFSSEVAVPHIALVVGAEDYERLDRVPNALNDAEAVAGKLLQLGFSFVRYVPNPNEDEIYHYIKELSQRAGSSEKPVIVVFFFAGHGFQQGGTNYIVPVNAPQEPEDLLQSAIPVTSMLESFAEHRNGLAIFFFDSCRARLDGITQEDAIRTPGTRPGTRAYIEFASKYPETANSYVDKTDSDSPFTYALLDQIDKEGLPLTVMAELVSDKVGENTRTLKPAQQPEPIDDSGAGASGFYFRPGEKVKQDERTRWYATLKTNLWICVDRYKRRHPGSLYLQGALQWLSDPSRVDSPSGGAESCPDE